MQFGWGTRILRVIHGRDARATLSGAGNQSEIILSVVRVVFSRAERGDFKNILANIIFCWPVFFGGAMLMSRVLPSLFRFDTYTAVSGAAIYAISFGLVFWFRGVARSPRSDIRTPEKVTLTGFAAGFSLFRGSVSGMVSGAILGIFPALLVGLNNYGWIHRKGEWVSAIQFWPISILIGFIVGAVTGNLRKVSVIEKTYPNQGLWLSLRNTVLIWLVVGGCSSVAIWVYAILFIGSPSATLQDALLWGSVVGMLVAFGYGGLDFLYHITLRFILSLKGFAPFGQYTTFLDNMTHLGFLRKVGGGYMFLHGSLRKQFESYDPTGQGGKA